MQAPLLRDFQDIPHFTRTEYLRRVALRPKTFDPRRTSRFEWIIRERTSRNAVGWVSLRSGEHPRGVVELGYTLLAEYRGRGYATEAVSELVSFALGCEGVVSLEACCTPENLPSRRLLERLNFERHRLAENGAVVSGRPVDILIFRLSRGVHALTFQVSSAKTMLTSAFSKPK
jgi:RimJ/RimL family protein N-acetyltransferase